ncbi:hypothetical protein [Dyella sp. M7H15-1]|nr:hypothetical protein [Dyella sp. M7H15-1]
MHLTGTSTVFGISIAHGDTSEALHWAISIGSARWSAVSS